MTDEKLIAALLTSPNVRTAAKAAGISESAVYKRLRDKTFKAKYDQQRHLLLEQATGALQGHLNGAVATLASIMNDRSAPHQTRLNAAESIIRNCLKLTEQNEILARLDTLENEHDE